MERRRSVGRTWTPPFREAARLKCCPRPHAYLDIGGLACWAVGFLFVLTLMYIAGDQDRSAARAEAHRPVRRSNREAAGQRLNRGKRLFTLRRRCTLPACARSAPPAASPNQRGNASPARVGSIDLQLGSDAAGHSDDCVDDKAGRGNRIGRAARSTVGHRGPFVARLWASNLCVCATTLR
jgi:hypothetical protein